MKEGSLKLPKKIKKTTFFDKIKNRNKSKVKEKSNFEERISLFNKHLGKIFSDLIENEKLGMIIHTKEIVNKEDTKYVDEEGKERISIDWGSEFSDSDEEDIYENIDEVNQRKENLKKAALMKNEYEQRPGQLDVAYDEYEMNKLTGESFQHTKSPSKWKKVKKIFGKSKATDKPINLKELRNQEEIYEEIDENIKLKGIEQSPTIKSPSKSPTKSLQSKSPTKSPTKSIQSKSPTKSLQSKSPQASVKSTGFDTNAVKYIPPPPPPPMPNQQLTKPIYANEPDYVNINTNDSKSIKKTKPPRPPPPISKGRSPEDSLRSKRKDTTIDSSKDSEKNDQKKKDRKLTKFKKMFKQFSPKNENQSEKMRTRGVERLLKNKKIGKVGKMNKS